jgi:two-component system repressor protein LuxO
MLKKTKYDLILADMLMPEMDGYSLLEKINADSKIHSLIIIITAHNLVDDLMRAIGLGAYDILQKPFSANRLKLTIKNAINYQNLSDKYSKLKRTVRKGPAQK